MHTEKERAEEIGIFCSYVPSELIEASGFRPRFFTGLDSGETDPRLPSSLCTYVRRCASQLDRTLGTSLAGVVVTDSCYPMVRLADYLESRPHIRFVHRLSVPRLATEQAVEFFRGQLEMLVRCLSNHADSSLDHERLRSCMKSSATLRRLVEEVLRMVQTDRLDIPYSTLSRLLEDFCMLEPSQLRAEIESLVAQKAGRMRHQNGNRPRIMVSGAHFISSSMLLAIENFGGQIVRVDSCTHDRMVSNIHVNHTAVDPLRALALGYLNKSPCPRMAFGQNRIQTAADEARNGTIDGVVVVLTKSCTPHAYDVPLWRSRMNEAGVPVMVVETQEGDWSQGQALTRLEAFVESLSVKGSRHAI